MIKREIEDLGQAMLEHHGLTDWRVRAVYEEDDMGDEDDIAGSYGRTYYAEKLIWLNMRYAGDALVVREILLHEIAHALVGQNPNPHGPEFCAKAKEIGLGETKLFEPRNACIVCSTHPSRSQPCLCDECDWRHGEGMHPFHEGTAWCAEHDPTTGQR
jgi:hypothetical protein